MALQSGLIRVPLGRGLSQGEDPRLIVPGSMGEAHNVVVDRAGRYTARRGWAQLSATSEDGSAMPAPDRIDAAGAELLQVDRTTGHLWSFGPGRDRWERIGRLPPLSVERQPLVRTQATIVTGGVVRFGADDRYELRMWQHFDAVEEGFLNAYYRIHDATTGALISRDALVYSPARFGIPLLVRVGQSAWIVYAGGDDCRANRTTAALGGGDTLIDDSSQVFKFDACSSLTGATALVATAPLGMEAVNLFRLSEAGAITATGTLALGTSDDARDVSICPRAGDGAWVAAVSGFPNRALLVWRVDSTLAAVAGPITVVSDWKNVGWPSLGVDAAGDLWVAWTGYESDDHPDRAVHVRRILAGSNTLDGTVARKCYRATSWVAPQLLDDGLYLPVLLSPVDYNTYAGVGGAMEGVDPGGDQHLGLLRLDADDPTGPPAFAGLLVRNVCTVFTTQQRWAPLPDGRYQLAAVVRTRATKSNPVDGVDVLTLDPLGRRRAQGAQLAQQHAWALSGLWGYDGYDTHEVGFVQAPEVIAATASPSGEFAIPAGKYSYRTRYEALDDRGVLHVGPWSRERVVEVSEGDRSSTNLTILTTQATQHGRRAAYRSLSVAVYRSKVNGAAAGVTRYYRLTPYGAPTSSLTQPRLTYNDPLTDEQMEALGYGTEVSSGGRLPYEVPPPARALVATKRRCWLASAEDNRAVWFSQQILDGETPWWAEELSVQLLDTDERIEALAALDDQVVIFTRTRIYVLSDDGPTDTGDGAFAGPATVSTAFGCIDRASVLTTTRGIYFRAAAGICLLDRGLQVTVVGDPIRDLLDDPAVEVRGAVYDEAGARVIFHLFTTGQDVGHPSTLALYDERQAVWTTASSTEVDTILSLAYDRQNHALALASQFHVYREGTLGWDGTEGDPAWFDKRIATPWLRGGEVGSWSQVRLVHLEGEAGGPCTARLDAYYDYATSDPKRIDLDLTAVARGTQVVKQLGLPQQTFRALRLVLHEAPAGEAPGDLSAPAGVRWWGLALDATVVPGPARIDTADRGGLSLCRRRARARCWAPSRAARQGPISGARRGSASGRRRAGCSAGCSAGPSTSRPPSPPPTSTRRSTTPAATTRSARTPRPRPTRQRCAAGPRPIGALMTRAAPWRCRTATGRWRSPTTWTLSFRASA